MTTHHIFNPNHNSKITSSGLQKYWYIYVNK